MYIVNRQIVNCMTLQLNRNTTPIKMRNYGRIVQDLISYASQMEAGVERDSLELYIAQCMRQRNLVWNRDQETGLNRVKEDIIRLSDGKLQCESPLFMQFMAQPGMVGMGQKRKKK